METVVGLSLDVLSKSKPLSRYLCPLSSLGHFFLGEDVAGRETLFHIISRGTFPKNGETLRGTRKEGARGGRQSVRDAASVNVGKATKTRIQISVVNSPTYTQSHKLIPTYLWTFPLLFFPVPLLLSRSVGFATLCRYRGCRYALSHFFLRQSRPLGAKKSPQPVCHTLFFCKNTLCMQMFILGVR